MGVHLEMPEEPTDLLAEARERIHQSPGGGLERIDSGQLITDTLWPAWSDRLGQAGIEREEFQRIVIGYRNEVRLWVMGERTWSHCIEGLIGRIERRTKSEPP